jgi:hypothetical protein
MAEQLPLLTTTCKWCQHPNHIEVRWCTNCYHDPRLEPSQCRCLPCLYANIKTFDTEL